MINLNMVYSGVMGYVLGFIMMRVVTGVLWVHKQMGKGFMKPGKLGREYNTLFV